ncbi:MAG: DUF362 domain-containing protein [Bacteroidales bacterium]|nr:DUF362 domain-containing protein [Bacteroidales bacterium]
MRLRISKKITTRALLILSLVIFVYWDFHKSVKASLATGTFRLESDFPTTTYTGTTVAIVPSDYNELTSPVGRATDPTYAQVEDMVRKAIELQGGLSGVVNPGDTVMLKVNLVGGSSTSGDGENTDVRVVKALIKILDDSTSGDVTIIVAEGTARTNDDFNIAGSVWHNNGYVDLLSDAYLSGIDFYLLNLNQSLGDIVEVDLGANATADPHNSVYHVHKQEVEADVYISVPVLKIHDTGITNALKNQIGTAPGCYYGYNKTAGTASYPSGLIHDLEQRRWTTEEIVDLSNVAGIDFVVVDAIMILEEYKSYDPSRKVRMNTVVAGVDPVAVDNVCSRILGLNPDDISHITLAEKVGLGTNNSYKIQIEGASINDVLKRVKQNPSENGNFGQSCRTWLVSQTYTGTISTEHIPGEDTLKPVAGVGGWSQPTYFFDDRIDLYSYFNNPSGIVSYAFTYFYAPQTQDAVLQVGSDEAMWVYINGEKVYEYNGTRTYSESQSYIENDTANITIKAGNNTLMVKTYQSLGDYSFALNIAEPYVALPYIISANRVEGLKFFTEKPTNAPPTEVLCASDGIDENCALNTFAGKLSVIDPDPDEEYNFYFATGDGDDNNNLLLISGDSLLVNHTIDYESCDTIRVRIYAEDKNDPFSCITERIKIPVRDIAEAPRSIEISDTLVAEGLPIGSFVALITADDDAGDTHEYELVSGTGSAGNGSFMISGDSLLTMDIFHYATQSSYNIRLKCIDNTGFELEQTFVIKVINPINIIERKENFKDVCTLYPNPFRNTINLKSISQDKIQSIDIFDISGKVVYFENALYNSELSVNTSELMYGTYLMRVNIGGRYYNTTVVKQK